MSLEPVRLLAVDCFGTLVDAKRGLADRFGKRGLEQPENLATAWIKAVTAETRSVDSPLRFRPFREILETTLEHSLKSYGISVDAASKKELLAVWGNLPLSPDARPALERWRDHGAIAWVVTNGDMDTVQELMHRHDLGQLLRGVYTAGSVRKYKPAREMYRGAAAAAGVLPAQMVMAAAMPYDASGAILAGSRGAWIRREPGEAPEPPPEWIVADLQELVETLQPLLPQSGGFKNVF